MQKTTTESTGQKEKPMTSLERKRAKALNYFWDRFKARPGQQKMGWALFEGGYKIIFLRYGRNGGKSFGAAGCMAKYAIENDEVQVLYFAPLVKQAQNIMWRPRLLHKLIDPDFVESIDKDAMTITLINGSIIQCDGSNQDPDIVRGYKPNFVVADEYAQFKPYWQEAMFPNLAAKDAPILMIGTPPEFPITEDGDKHHYVQMDEECQRYHKDPENKRVYWGWLPTWEANPKISKEWLAQERQRLFDRGEDYVWYREYGGKIVSGASRQIFPMFNKDTHVVDHDKLLAHIDAIREHCEFWVGADPGTRGVFAVVFMAVNHYTSEIYWLDELYETDASNTIASIMNQQIEEKLHELGPDEEWRYICDNAAASYIEESASEPDFPVLWDETLKELNDKKNGISLLKTLFSKRSKCMSDRCFYTANEFIRLQRDKAGRIPKKGDHTIDGSRYVGKESGFDFNTSDAPKRLPEADPEETAYLGNAEQKMKNWLSGEDFFGEILNSYE